MKNEKQTAERIRESYIPKTKQQTKLDELKELDSKVKKPVRIFSYILGTVGSLVFGAGMCIAMGVVGGLMPVGIAVGLLGGAIMGATYPLHKKILSSRKEKYASEILEKSNAIIEDYTPAKSQETSRVYETYHYNNSNSKNNDLQK